MRLLSLDYDPVYGDDADVAPFHSDASIFDFDAVIWDPEASFRYYMPGYSYSGINTYQGLPSLSEDMSVRIRADAVRRRKEFLEFLQAGRSIVVLVRPPQECYVDTGERTHSGTGRNRVTTTHVAPFDLWSALPVSTVRFEKASGSRIEILGDGPIPSLLRHHQSFLGYTAVLTAGPGTAVAKVPGTDRVLGTVMRIKQGGLVVMLPAIDFTVETGSDDEDDGWADEAPQFQADLLAALLELSAGGVQSRPAWADHYATEAQQQLQAAVVAQQRKVENARGRLAKIQAQRQEAETRDQLFLGTGRALELQVRDVMELLGGTVKEPEPGRDDWRVAFPEGDAVLEVKRVTKSAAEKHAAQLEKWVAGTYEAVGNMPKGILVVNTWRELPPDQRDEKEDFPVQMRPYCEGRGHCLVTGLQLFLIRSDVEADSERASYWRDLLLKTNGVMTEPSDWRAVLQKTRAEDASESD